MGIGQKAEQYAVKNLINEALGAKVIGVGGLLHSEDLNGYVNTGYIQDYMLNYQDGKWYKNYPEANNFHSGWSNPASTEKQAELNDLKRIGDFANDIEKRSSHDRSWLEDFKNNKEWREELHELFDNFKQKYFNSSQIEQEPSLKLTENSQTFQPQTLAANASTMDIINHAYAAAISDNPDQNFKLAMQDVSSTQFAADVKVEAKELTQAYEAQQAALQVEVESPVMRGPVMRL